MPEGQIDLFLEAAVSFSQNNKKRVRAARMVFLEWQPAASPLQLCVQLVIAVFSIKW